jgi:DNA modification methylase
MPRMAHSLTRAGLSPRARIVHGDSMDALRRLQDHSAAAIITDPPYGIGYESFTGQSILNDDGPYIWWLREAWRITRPGGALLCFCRWDTQDVFKMAAEAACWRVRSQVIWDRDVPGQGDCKAQFAPQHEVVWFAVKGRGFAFPGGRPRSVIRCRYVRPSGRVHPTEKPVPLMEQLVRAVTRPADLVVDPFAGSGSTGVACVNLGRAFLGIELAAEHAATARRRLAAARRSADRRPVE